MANRNAGDLLRTFDAVPVATLSTVPTGAAMLLTGTFRDSGHSGVVEAYNSLSTNDPATRDLHLLNSQCANTLARVTDNL